MRLTNAIFRICYSKVVSHHYLGLAEAQKQAEEWESFTVEKREGFSFDLSASSWHGEAEGRLTRSRIHMRLIMGAYLAFSSWS